MIHAARVLLVGVSCVLGPSAAGAGLPGATATGGAEASPRVRPPSGEEVSGYELDPGFYRKCALAAGILIATSERVADLAILETAWQFEQVMTQLAQPVAQRIRARRPLCILIGHNELTSDLPQFGTDKRGEERDFYNWRQRGFLTSLGGRPTVVFAEEDVMEYEGGMQLESILIHEFGHVIHGAGFDDDLQRRLTETYQRAVAAGLWNDGRAAQRFRRVTGDASVSLEQALVKAFPGESPELIRKCLEAGDILVNGQPARPDATVTGKDQVLIVFGGAKECYARKNRAEYWAEGVQNWFDTNRTMDHDHNHIHTRAQLMDYDPGLAALCREVLGDSPWRFVSPRERAGQGHLANYDPAQAPKVENAPHIMAAANDYYDRYWADYWQRLYDKHGIQRPAGAKREVE